ncbi:MAG: hypothetical protein CMJ83_22280 [Planctomycetes bacterium]|nr:hypothetical protein [Planctomycetota bacterium]
MEATLSAILSLILSASGASVTVDDLATDFARRDVVFLGEEHDNDAGHRMQLDIVRALYARRADLVISMEMFERDVQGVMNDYLRGRIDEKTFLEHSRPWKGYKKHYRPIIEFAKANGLDVICACSPWRLSKVKEVGGDPDAYIARSITTPKDRYFDLFKESMKEHPGEIDAKAMDRMYLGQCRRDDTMAEAIADYLQGHRHRRPLVVHLNGKFHSDYGLGTAIRVLQRRPLAQIGVVSMQSAEDPAKAEVAKDLDRAHYTLVVKAQPKKKPAKPVAKATKPNDEKPAKPAAGVTPPKPTKPTETVEVTLGVSHR